MAAGLCREIECGSRRQGLANPPGAKTDEQSGHSRVSMQKEMLSDTSGDGERPIKKGRRIGSPFTVYDKDSWGGTKLLTEKDPVHINIPSTDAFLVV